jgi:hypothetical protein
MADQETERRLQNLEREVTGLKSRLDELVRLLKQAEDANVQRAARKAR